MSAGRIPAKPWSTLVKIMKWKPWSKSGQTLVKLWSNSGQTLTRGALVVLVLHLKGEGPQQQHVQHHARGPHVNLTSSHGHEGA